MSHETHETQQQAAAQTTQTVQTTQTAQTAQSAQPQLQDVNARMFGLGAEPSAIRELFAYGLERKAQIGAENVFDFSIGNPSVPAPAAVKEAIADLLNEDPVQLHGYTPASGNYSTRKAVAENIKRRFNMPATPENVYMTSGAAASLGITFQAITNPGDEIITIAPFFPEYQTFVESAHCTLVPVLARETDFQIDIPAVQAAINEKTRAVLINTPNNPTGAVYTRENLEQLAALLTQKEQELGHALYLISDEPYREISYGKEIPYVPTIYPRTIVCYSWSKSLSLPGERIGYIYVSDYAPNAREVSTAIAGAGRALSYVCAPALFQRVIERCIDEPSNVEAYRENREILSQGLKKLGYEYVEPDGAFYLWVKALEPNAEAFCEAAKKFELLLVPSNSFGCEGWMRLSYCIAKDTIVNSLPAFAALKESYEK